MFKITENDSELLKKMDCPGSHTHLNIQLIQKLPNPFSESWEPKPCIMIQKYMQFAESIKNFEVRADDVWIITYPKCGTTWAQEMIWLLCNNLDYETAKAVNLNARSPFLEITGIAATIPGDSVKSVANLSSPRFIKSHLPISLLPYQLWTIKPKIVYVVRNPKDVAVSYYHHYSNVVGYTGTKEDFWDAFLDDKIIYGSYFQHILEFYKIKDSENILFLSYENMKSNLNLVLQNTSKFFNKTYNDEELRYLEKHLSFESMKDNPSCNNEQLVASASSMNGKAGTKFKFLRKGIVGSYKDELGDDYIRRIDEWTEKNLQGTDFKFDD